MKKITFVTLLFLFTFLSFSQGISVQGIARNVNNDALTNQNISLTFDVYYTDSNNIYQSVYSVTETLPTDAFGVFSYVLDDAELTDSQFSSNKLHLKITQGNVTISDEPFKRVPYAYSSNNGYPTGVIMPYMAATAPEGWLLCDGTAIPINPNTEALRTLLGTGNTPDLRAAFLRGSGTNSVQSSYSGVGVGTFQRDDNKLHLHSGSSLTTSVNGNHTHEFTNTATSWNDYGTAAPFGGYYTQGSPTSLFMNRAGNHNHLLSGSTALFGTESRPYNMGVNYIIKL